MFFLSDDQSQNAPRGSGTYRSGFTHIPATPQQRWWRTLRADFRLPRRLLLLCGGVKKKRESDLVFTYYAGRGQGQQHTKQRAMVRVVEQMSANCMAGCSYSSSGDRVYTLKFVLVGSRGVGKTRLASLFHSKKGGCPSAAVGMQFGTRTLRYSDSLSVRAQVCIFCDGLFSCKFLFLSPVLLQWNCTHTDDGLFREHGSESLASTV